jgi:hypothetical protein
MATMTLACLLDGTHLEQAVSEGADALVRVADRDWSAPAHGLDWSCRATAEHVADCHLGYALLVTGRRTDSYLPLDVVLSDRARPADVPALLRGTGALLGAALATAPAGVVVWHPYGMADLDAVTGMGIVETLVHAWDITSALGEPFAPDPGLAAATLARMFPDVRPAADPWRTLLWATGRAELEDRSRRTHWRWTNDLGARSSQAVTSPPGVATTQ